MNISSRANDILMFSHFLSRANISSRCNSILVNSRVGWNLRHRLPSLRFSSASNGAPDDVRMWRNTCETAPIDISMWWRWSYDTNCKCYVFQQCLPARLSAWLPGCLPDSLPFCLASDTCSPFSPLCPFICSIWNRPSTDLFLFFKHKTCEFDLHLFVSLLSLSPSFSSTRW